eukprot:363203-Chlamydomonas_euryale.AAC.30
MLPGWPQWISASGRPSCGHSARSRMHVSTPDRGCAGEQVGTWGRSAPGHAVNPSQTVHTVPLL